MEAGDGTIHVRSRPVLAELELGAAASDEKLHADDRPELTVEGRRRVVNGPGVGTG
jgi:hypothetical protein